MSRPGEPSAVVEGAQVPVAQWALAAKNTAGALIVALALSVPLLIRTSPTTQGE